MTKGVAYNGSKMIEDIHRPTNCHRQPNKKEINLKTGKRPPRRLVAVDRDVTVSLKKV